MGSDPVISSSSGPEFEFLFVTLAMFIIDEIHPLPPKPPHFDVIGGAGMFSALGARLLCPPPLSSSIGWIVDAGHDFPVKIRNALGEWETGCVVRNRNGPTTRGWNGFAADGVRSFRYTTPKLRLDAADLSPAQLSSRSFHFISSPTRCVSMSQNILSARESSSAPPKNQPVFIWEPVPDLCIPSELENCYCACKYVDVISPNDNELLSFFGQEKITGSERWAMIEKCTENLLSSRIGRHREGSVVVRAGPKGCYVATILPELGLKSVWLPAYHQDEWKVVDPTGGGNAFLGGFALGLVSSKEEDGFDQLVEAASFGSVAASLCIEQVGVPRLEKRQGGGEHWNGIDVFQRLQEFKSRLKTG
ncbi:MAG: hypothetical protein M1822_001634 [Bathelium mastoideum]|nr:MAG: hypothetical protein M1822_001634 [Bathelium mastoideum]